MERRRAFGMVVGLGAFSVLLLAAAAGVLSGTIEGDPRPEATSSAAPGDPAGRGDAASPSPEPAPRERGGTVVIWARDDLPADLVTSVASVAGITAVAEVRSDTLGLIGARTAAGEPVLALSDGFRVPVEVAAVDPASYGEVLADTASADALAALRPGVVLLTESGAALRGIGRGGQIDLVDLAGLEVVGVVPSGVVRRGEIVLHHHDSEAAGLEDDPSIVARHDAAPGSETDRLVAAIEALIPDAVHARVVATGGGDGRRGPLVLSLTEVKQRFGEFAFRPRAGAREIDVESSFVAANITTTDVPLLGSVTCHRGIIDDLRGALQQIADAGLAGEIDPARYAGCYYPRKISVERSRLSNHSWGIALDINVDLSLPDLGPPPRPEVIAAFEAHGFRWGGDFLTPDNHHFEWIGEVTEPPTAAGR